MATDAGPYYFNADTGEMVFYFGWLDDAGNMLELAKSPYNAYYQQNVLYGGFSDYIVFIDSILGPGFTQRWGALGYFIRPEYLDKLSRYQPQILNTGNIPSGGYIGQYR
jgi:hypothetical protein